MNRPVRWLAGAALFGALGCAGGSGGPAAAPPIPAAVCATILSTNDTHGRLLPAEYDFAEGRELGGSAALGGFFGEIRGASECPVFLVSGGDVMQGTLISNLTDGASTIEAMNALGYDAVATGNHEFDWGIETFRARIREARFPFLGANIFLAGTRRHPEWIRPYAIIERDGVRVGFIGLTTQSTPTTTRPANVESLEFGRISDALDRYIPEIRTQGVDFVVPVMHAGGFCDSDDVCTGEAIRELQATTEPFDYAVAGHSHTRVRTVIHGAPVVESFSYTTAFGHGRIDRGSNGQVSARIIDIRRTYVDEITPDPAIAALVERHLANVATLMAREVVTLAEPFPAPRLTEHALGNLIADAQRAATGSQVAIMNNGGIRRGLPQGPITYADLFELQPFANTLVHLRLSGRALLEAFEHSLGSGARGAPDAHLSGVVVEYDPAAPAGARVRRARLEDGTPIDPDRTYDVTVNDFMAAGGSGFDMFLEADEARMTGVVDLDALVEHLESLPGPVAPPTGARWIARP